ncbi:50S ribosomal protein L22 [Candidatus Contubernalis alkaliaceticus]|uniref:50S ribosomal protein L22 n=1 Tax=Candidatus Contubernalis alkaliaceticus TaxID=338645 RepID=UPI001F4C1551|nr:50S ribosomal protein L22 [Candidatus Contubernalis alkalaceticus]UNC90942.1 50S ribosomal protein L22 [Candidatus Contubernalis alkalaceticus]
MEAKAVARYVRVTPSKVRLIADLIREKNVDQALSILKFTPNKGARVLEKVLISAIANAEHNYEMDVNALFVAKAYIDEGPTLKRWRAKAMGRVGRIRRRTSHITVILQEREG